MKKIVTRIISVFIVASLIMSAGCISTAVPSEQEHESMEIGEQEPATQSQQETVEKEPDHGRPRTIREEQTLVIVGPDQPVEEEEEREFSVAVEWLMNHAHMSFTVGAPEQAPEDKSVVVAWLMNNVHMSFTEGAPEVAPEDKSPAVAWLMNHVYKDTTPKEYKDTIVGMPGLAPEPRITDVEAPVIESSIKDPAEKENEFHISESETRLPTQGELEFGIAPHDRDDPGLERDKPSKPEEGRTERPGSMDDGTAPKNVTTDPR